MFYTVSDTFISAAERVFTVTWRHRKMVQYEDGYAWQKQQKEPGCMGHLKSTCTGDCGFYKKCLEKTTAVALRTAERDFDVPKE